MTHGPQQLPPVATHHPADGDTGEREVSPAQQVREEAWKQFDEFATSGKGIKASELPHVIQRIGWSDGIKARLPEAARFAPGGTMIECARLASLPIVDALVLALETAKTPASSAEVQRYLQTHERAELAKLDTNVGLVDKLRAVFAKRPFGEVMPEIADVPVELHDRPNLIKWFVETTTPTVAAYHLATSGDTVVATLDKLDAWSWLDHIRLASHITYASGLAKMRDATTNAAAKAKLTSLAAQFTADAGQRQVETIAANSEIHSQLRGKDDVALLETAARTQRSMQPLDDKQVGKRLAGESADLVLHFLIATFPSVARGIETLFAATGTRSEHLREFLHAQDDNEVVMALTNDRLRKMVRSVLGRGASLLGLFPRSNYDFIHVDVVRDAALRQWVYEDDHPETLLWLAVGSRSAASEGCRLVRKEKSNDWVSRLSAAADEVQLRRFALSSRDDAAVGRVRALLNDPADRVQDPSQEEVVHPSQIVYGAGADTRLMLATHEVGADGRTAVERLADLDARERVAVMKNPQQLRDLLDDVTGDELVRAMFLLSPTVLQLAALPLPKTLPRPVSSLIPYLQSRADVEGYMLVRDEAGVRALRALLPGFGPLYLFPVLQIGKTLAKAIYDNSTLFEWIMEETEPSFAMKILALPEVRHLAAQMFSERPEFAENLPSHAHMLKQGRTAYQVIHERVDDMTKEDSQEWIDGDASVDRDVDGRAKALQDSVRSNETLWDELLALDKDGHADRGNVLTLVQRAKVADQIKLLDGSHTDAVGVVRRTGLPAQAVFPALSIEQLFALRATSKWLFVWESPSVILSLLAKQPAAIPHAARQIDADHTSIGHWPRGGALMAHERMALDALGKAVIMAEALRTLFTLRFDVEVTAFNLAETRKLWNVVARLPPGQFDQKAVRAVVEKDIGGPLGQWNDPDVEIDDDHERFDDPGKLFDEGQKMTITEVKQVYGLDDKGVQKAVDDGWLLEEQGVYKMAPLEWPSFDSTVLHEVGHSIDTMLGEQTELIFGLGAWRTFGLDQFEEWASTMNGFDGIPTTDRPRVVAAWRDAIESRTPVKDLVDDDHPALKGPASAPLIDAAKRGSLFRYAEADQPIYGSTACVANGSSLYSMPKLTYLSAPTSYALNAPGEYFAECYVEYYRQFDGTPKTANLKGGRLAPWIKQWFDTNVDKIRLNPQRVKAPQP